MSRDQWIGIAVAVALHAVILFAFRISREPIPLPMGNDPIQVDLVAAAPEPQNPETMPSDAAETAVSQFEDMVTPVPEPEPTSSLTPPPTPESSPPPPLPTPISTPRSQTTLKPVAKKQPTPKPSKPPSSTAKLGTTKPSVASKKSATAAEHSGGAVAGGRGDSAPSYRNNPQPVYPEEARRQEQEGLVILDVLVSAEGRAVKVTLRRSSGVRILDQAAMAAVRRWSFQSGRIAGVPAAAHIDVPIRFRLDR